MNRARIWVRMPDGEVRQIAKRNRWAWVSRGAVVIDEPVEDEPEEAENINGG